MKIKAIINCTGEGYKNLKVGETREVKKEVAEKLIEFGYVEEVKKSTTKK